MKRSTCYTEIPSPLGTLLIRGSGSAITGLFMGPVRDWMKKETAGWRRNDAFFTAIQAQLKAYFEGNRRLFDLHLDLQGTPFQIRVWSALREIPYGQTVTYGELARRVGRPGAARAVGLANGANPVPIVVPCHRVIGSDGRLTGYSGGMDNKRILLDIEARGGKA